MAPGLSRTPFGRQLGVCFLFVFAGLFLLGINPKFPINRLRPSVAAGTANRLVTTYGKLPLSFEVNQGQADQTVRFISRGRGYALFLTRNEAVLTLKKSLVAASLSPAVSGRMPAITPAQQRTADSGRRTTDAVLRMRLVGENASAAVAGAEELPGKANYFLGNDPKKWRTNVPTYAQVKYRNVYPGVDLVYYGDQSGRLEYDFVVAPGADPGVIALDVATSLPRHRASKNDGDKSRLRISSAGDLIVPLNDSEVRIHKPVVYQTDSKPHRRSTIDNRLWLDGRYLLTSSNRVRVALGAYDRTKPLVIDPVLSYSTYLGGESAIVSSIAVDSSGSAYLTGQTDSTDFFGFPTANPLQASPGGGYDAFVTKLDAAGSALVYSTYLGGSGNDEGYGIAVDSSGDAYVTGQTDSTDFPVSSPIQTTCSGCGQGYAAAFVTKLNAAGSGLVYSTYLGGNATASNGGDSGNSIAVDSSGNAYVTGSTASTDFPTVNPIQATCGGCSQGYATAFVAKLNATATALVYSTYLGGSGGDGASGIAADSSGNAYVTGTTASTDFPTAKPLQARAGGGGDAFVAKLNAAGSGLLYSTYLGGSAGDGASGIAVDSSGNAYVTGSTASTDFPTAKPIQATCVCSYGYTAVFVTKLNAAGSGLVYSTYLGGGGQVTPETNGDFGNGIAVDSSANAYVTGSTAGPFPTVVPWQATRHGTSDAFVAKLNSDGSALIYSTYLGGGTPNGAGHAYNGGSGVAVDSSGNAYVTGYTDTTDFPTANPLQASARGAFVAKFVPGPGVSLSTSTLAFGTELVSTTTPQQGVFLTNNGDTSLDLTSIVASSGFALVTTDTSCPYGGGSVKLQTQCAINISFTPTTTGDLTGTVTITDNALSNPQTIALTGTGIVSAPAISPKNLNFTSQLIGTTSASQPVTITNTGTAAMEFSNVAISSGWTQSNNCLPSVGPGSSCTINVTFQPTFSGPVTGAVTITDYAANSPQTVGLTGTGTAPVASLTPASLTFSPQTMGTTSASQQVALTDTGSGSLAVTGVATTAGFGETNNCGGSVAAGGSCTINVTFSPMAGGSLTGTLTVTDNENGVAGSTQSVALSGTGQDFSFAPSSGSSTSATVAPGSPATYTLGVGGEGGFNQGVSFTCSGAPSEAVCTVSPSQVTAGNSATNVTVTVTTTAASASAPHARHLPPTPPLSPGIRYACMLALVLAWTAWTIARRNELGVGRWRFTIVPLAAGLLLFLALAGCGGGGATMTPSNPGTPAGTYTLKVTGTAGSGSSALSHSVTLTLNVS